MFHKDVNYEALCTEEKRIKASRELFTIFYLNNGKGLTDMEIHKEALRLGMTGYDGYTPDCIVRSNIYRWNDMAVKPVTGGTKCSEEDCKKICTYGYVKDKPTRCNTHKFKNMIRVVEERLVKCKKEPGHSKGKYYLDETFGKKVFGDTYVIKSFTPVDVTSAHVVKKVDIKTETSSIKEEDKDILGDGRINNLLSDNILQHDISSFSSGSFLSPLSTEMQQSDTVCMQNPVTRSEFDFNEYIFDLNLDISLEPTFQPNLQSLQNQQPLLPTFENGFINDGLLSNESNINGGSTFMENNDINSVFNNFTDFSDFNNLDYLQPRNGNINGIDGNNINDFRLPLLNFDSDLNNFSNNFDFNSDFVSNYPNSSLDDWLSDPTLSLPPLDIPSGDLFSSSFSSYDPDHQFIHYRKNDMSADLKTQNSSIIQPNHDNRTDDPFVHGDEQVDKVGDDKENIHIEIDPTLQESDDIFNKLISGEFSNIELPFIGNPLLMNIDMNSDEE